MKDNHQDTKTRKGTISNREAALPQKEARDEQAVFCVYRLPVVGEHPGGVRAGRHAAAHANGHFRTSDGHTHQTNGDARDANLHAGTTHTHAHPTDTNADSKAIRSSRLDIVYERERRA